MHGLKRKGLMRADLKIEKGRTRSADWGEGNWWCKIKVNTDMTGNLGHGVARKKNGLFPTVATSPCVSGHTGTPALSPRYN